MKVCIYDQIEVIPVTGEKRIIGRGPSAQARWKHIAQVSPTGEPNCGRGNLSEDETEDLEEASE